MWSEATESQWQQEAELVMSGIMEWRIQHPRASLQEIEQALDERLAKLRARMVQDLALKSAAARMTDHETLSRLATVETHRRGTAGAGTVCAVNDGAEWEQTVITDHRPDAVRILDWGHSAEHVSDVARATFGSDTPAE